jgi:hypothetical protein
MFNSLALSIKNSFTKYTLYVFFIFGTFLLPSGYFLHKNIEGIDWGAVLINIGSVLLSGGVFAVIVKSAQFSEIFENTLRNIIYQKEHLAVRDDLENIWGEVTIALSKQRFSAISEQMHLNIKKYFLPLDHDYYYNDTKITLDLDIDPDYPDYLVVTEKQTTNLIAEDECLMIRYKYINGIPFDSLSPELTNYKLVSFKVNGKEVDTTAKLKRTTVKNDLLISFEHELTGFTKYSIVREEKKRYSIKLNSNKRQLASWVYNNCFINLTYSKALEIEFYDFGVLNQWRVDYNTSNKQYNKLEAEYKGLIYKNQGFLLHLK